MYVHESLVFLPSAGLYVPAGQFIPTSLPVGQYKPVGHISPVVLSRGAAVEAPSVQYEPA